MNTKNTRINTIRLTIYTKNRSIKWMLKRNPNMMSIKRRRKQTNMKSTSTRIKLTKTIKNNTTNTNKTTNNIKNIKRDINTRKITSMNLTTATSSSIRNNTISLINHQNKEHGRFINSKAHLTLRAITKMRQTIIKSRKRV